MPAAGAGGGQGEHENPGRWLTSNNWPCGRTYQMAGRSHAPPSLQWAPVQAPGIGCEQRWAGSKQASRRAGRQKQAKPGQPSHAAEASSA